MEKLLMERRQRLPEEKNKFKFRNRKKSDTASYYLPLILLNLLISKK